MAKLIDSSVWIALYLEKDSQHAKAERLFRDLAEKIYLPAYVLSEVTAVLVYKHSKSQADAFVQFVMTHPSIEWLESESYEDAAYFLSHSKRLSFIDLALLRLAKKLKIELVTYDSQLARLARKV